MATKEFQGTQPRLASAFMCTGYSRLVAALLPRELSAGALEAPDPVLRDIPGMSDFPKTAQFVIKQSPLLSRPRCLTAISVRLPINSSCSLADCAALR